MHPKDQDQKTNKTAPTFKVFLVIFNIKEEGCLIFFFSPQVLRVNNTKIPSQSENKVETFLSCCFQELNLPQKSRTEGKTVADQCILLQILEMQQKGRCFACSAAHLKALELDTTQKIPHLVPILKTV